MLIDIYCSVSWWCLRVCVYDDADDKHTTKCLCITTDAIKRCVHTYIYIYTLNTQAMLTMNMKTITNYVVIISFGYVMQLLLPLPPALANIHYYCPTKANDLVNVVQCISNAPHMTRNDIRKLSVGTHIQKHTHHIHQRIILICIILSSTVAYC